MSTSSVPPKFVPTLTEIVRPSPGAASVVAAHESLPAAIGTLSQEQMIQRVLQRVDVILERRLREVVGQLILAHTQTLAPRLREEVEDVVRQSVMQAFAQELPPGDSR
jgi:hypothetical protein